MTIKEDITWRTALVYISILILAGCIMAKALLVMTIEGEKWKNIKAPGNTPPQPVKVYPNRGDIWADDGRILATSVPFYELRFDPVAVNKKVFDKNVDSLAICLSDFFKDASKTYYKNKLKTARNRRPIPDRYLLINDRKVDHTGLKKIREFPIFRLGKNKGGFRAIVYNKRIQPHVNLATRTIGYLNENEEGNFEGRVGLEGAFENQLKGKTGEGTKRMMSGTWMIITNKEPVDGQDVVTTIDVDYQDIVQHALMRQLEKYEAGNGTAILMEVKTGDIKAIANMTRTAAGGYVENLNYAIGDAGEPGSVIKAATMIAMLEDGYVTPEDTVDLGGTGIYKFYDRKMTDSDGKKPGKITVKHIFEISSNGIARLVNDHYKNNPKKFVDRLYDMGLNKELGLTIKGETKPLIKYPGEKGWSGITLPWMSIGYELQLTPLQILAFYNAIANDGQRMKPRFVKEIRNRGEVIETFPTEEIGGRICSKKTLREIREMLQGVVKNGTAKNIYTDKYSIAGKTGTARLADGAKGYGIRKYRASFAGYFPADDPLYSCVVVIDNPSLSKGFYANVVSGAIFREIADKVYSMAYVQHGKPEYEPDKTLPVSKNGLKKDFLTIFDELDMDIDGRYEVQQCDWVMTASAETQNITLKPRKVDYTKVPNVKGMGLRDALYLLENTKLNVGVSGSGMVQNQSIQPGTRVSRGSYIHIELR